MRILIDIFTCYSYCQFCGNDFPIDLLEIIHDENEFERFACQICYTQIMRKNKIMQKALGKSRGILNKSLLKTIMKNE